MSQCDSLMTCPFFNDKMSMASSLSEIYKNKYCRKDKENCARYMVRTALGKEKVPIDLFPNMVEKARQIIAAG